MRQTQPDLILLDVMMPKMNEFEVCRRLRSDVSLPFIPIIMVTAKADPKDVVADLEAGGDEYLTKPVDQPVLVARVKSMLRIKNLHDTVETLAAERAEWNKTLERRLEEQVGQLEQLGRLKRFDPLPVPDPVERAVRMAVAMRERVHHLVVVWQKRGYDLALGVGIAQGYATIGAIGFEGRCDYGAIGTVTNLVARLCGEAKGGQILVHQRVAATIEELADLEEIGPLALKGLARPVSAFNIVRLTSA